MKEFFKNLFGAISKLDFFVNNYKKQTKVMALPSVAYVNWGLYLAEIGLVDEAMEKFQMSSSMAYPTSDSFVNLAIGLAQQQKYNEACAQLRKATKVDPQNVRAFCVWSSILSDKGEYYESEKMLKQANKLSPKNPDVYIYWGILLAKQNRKGEAREKFNLAILYSPMNVRAIFFLGILDMESEMYGEALGRLRIVLEYQHDNAEAYFYMAFCALNLKKLPEAITYITESLKYNPHKHEAYIMLADCYAKLNDKENCLKTYEVAEANGIAGCLFYASWGLALQTFGEFELSNTALNKSLMENPHDFNVIFIRAVNYVHLNNTQRARELLERVLDMSPRHTDALFNLGLVIQQQHDYDGAIHTFERAMKTDRKTEYMYAHIANCYYAKNELETAAQFYAKSIEYNPKDMASLINYSNIMADLKNYNEALRKIRTAYQLDKDSPKLNYLYGLILLKCENYKDALEKFEHALSLSENYKDAKYGKAEALLYSKREKEAIAYLQTQLDENPDDLRYMHLMGLSYYRLALKMPSDYNIGTAIEYCDRVLQLRGDDTYIQEKKHQLNELQTQGLQ